MTSLMTSNWNLEARSGIQKRRSRSFSRTSATAGWRRNCWWQGWRGWRKKKEKGVSCGWWSSERKDVVAGNGG
uniref:Uncharacterized protein n=1 Tax=Glycine max TaxID=3847 RepID=A0A0R0HDP3_SOYBN